MFPPVCKERKIGLSIIPYRFTVLVLTSIVIGLGTLALMVALCLRMYEKYKTFDMSKINTLKG